jgi:TolB-like protein/Tfp pilus assembly protein PilF
MSIFLGAEPSNPDDTLYSSPPKAADVLAPEDESNAPLYERLRRLVDELRRRKVIRTAGVYLVGAFAIMQVVDAVFPYAPFGDPDAAGTIVLALLSIGFPIALTLSWILEFEPPQLHRELLREEAEALRASARAIPKADLRPDSIAVLPFDNLSDAPDDIYFSDGVTGDIISAISQIEGLRVLCRTSVMQYRGVSRRVSEIAAELGVATVITGSVRHVGSRIRIVAEMIDAQLDDHVWSETYDRDVEDVFQLQSDVAQKVADAVQRELTPAARKRIEARGTTDPAAYDLYLRARFLWNQRSEASVEESLDFFQRSIDRDPQFALAHSGSAEALLVQGLYGAEPPETTMPAARAAAQRALDLDPTLGEALAAKACVSAVYDWAWDDAEEGFRCAIGLAPSYATIPQWLAANVLIPQRRFDEALAELDRASTLDPGSAAISVTRGIIRFYSRDYEHAIASLLATIETHPRLALTHTFLGQAQLMSGQVDESLKSLSTAVALSDTSSEMIANQAHALGVAGRVDEAEELLARLGHRSDRRYVSPALMAQVLVSLGRHDEAVDRLTAAVDLRATDLIWLAVRPTYDPLRSHAGFIRILAQLGLGFPL